MADQTDYDKAASLAVEEFKRARPDHAVLMDPTRFTKSDDADIAKIERILDLREGKLAEEEYFLERAQCRCGRVLTMYDFVLTALVDVGHSKSLIVHTFMGKRYILNEPRQVRCSTCARVNPTLLQYTCERYGCWDV